MADTFRYPPSAVPRWLPASHPSSGVGQPTIGRPFYGQAKGQLRLTWRPSAGSPQQRRISVRVDGDSLVGKYQSAERHQTVRRQTSDFSPPTITQDDGGRREGNSITLTINCGASRHHNPRAEGPSNLRTLGPQGPIHLKNLAFARPKGAHSWPPQSFPDFPSWYPGSFRRPPLPKWRGFLRGRRLLRPGSWPGRGPSFLR